MNMPLQAHDLHAEFPEYQQAIHDLKTSDMHFGKLFDEYHQVNAEIQRIEVEAVAAVSDEHMEALKKSRLKLKDELYHMLVKHAAGR